MKKLLLGVLLMIPLFSKSQSVGYELRTNQKSYVVFGYKNFEIRHRVDLKENRVSYRHNIPIGNNLIFSLPLHYKIEQHSPTLEPRLIYRFPKFRLWVQKEFWIDQPHNAAIAVDIPIKNISYRIGWDDSNTWRFRMMFNL